MKILIIEDEKSLLDSVLIYLNKEGYNCEQASDFRTASLKINLYQYDCVIVDICLPGGSGLDLVKIIKNLKNRPGIIIFSASDSVEDRVKGLEIGSDDYLIKPFHLSELNARIKSVIRRIKFEGNQAIVYNEIKIIPDQMTVLVHDENIILTKKEFNILIFFVSNYGRVLTKESIVEHIWGDDADMYDSFDFLYSHIKNLRKKMLEKGSRDYIQSVYGIGYKFFSL